MQTLSLQLYNQNEINGLAAFCQTYLKKYPDAKLMSPEFYTYHPALKDSKNVFCVLTEQQEMVGFAPLFPVMMTDDNGITGPHEIWTVMLENSEWETAVQIHELLFQAVMARVNSLKGEYGLSQIKLAADMMVSQKADIDYLLQKGFTPFEQIVVMVRDTSQAIPKVTTPSGIRFQQSKLATADEQAAYLAIYNTCFPHSPKTWEELLFLLQSSLWKQGCVIAAYSPSQEIVGTVLQYWNAEAGFAVTDDVMVLPEWRGQHIAQCLIREGLNYCQAQGMAEVRLEVKATNSPAVSVYSALGYRIINQETLLGMLI
jgi:GNAT superfamily N-acetyltransferase